MLRPRPSNSKTKHNKNSSVVTRMFVIKNNFVQKASKSDMMTSYIWHCFCTYCTKEHGCLLHFSITMSHSACRAQQRWKQDQKYKTKTKTEAGLRPVLS